MPLKSNCNHIVFIMEGKQKKNTFRFENTSLRFTIVEHIVLRIIYKPKIRLEKLYSNESFFKRVLNCSASLLRMESFILQVLSKT